jgi:hypothetical protein
VQPDLSGIASYVGSIVVLDTATPLLNIGTLEQVRDGFLTLTDVDVQDSKQMNSSKELYILEARKFGVKKNRHRVEVRGDVIVSISKLEEVIEY